MYLCLLLVIIFCLDETKQKSLIADFFQNYDATGIFINVDEKESLFELDMSIDFFWELIVHEGEVENLKYLRNENIILNNDEIDSKVYSTNIQISSTINPINISDFEYHTIFTVLYTSFDSFPLKYKFRNYENSIVHVLFEQGLIDKRAFVFEYSPHLVEQEASLGYIYFGGIDHKIKVDNPFQASCDVDTNKTLWGCEFTEFKMGNFSYSNSYYSLFNANIDKILYPKGFSNLLYKNVFWDYVNKNETCEYREGNFEVIFKCTGSALETLPDIKLTIGNIVFTLSPKEAFKYNSYSETYDFLLTENTRNENEWIFGTLLLFKQITEFNYDEGKINFYDSKPFTIKKKETSNSFFKIIFMIIAFCQIINCIILILSKIKYKKLNKD